MHLIDPRRVSPGVDGFLPALIVISAALALIASRVPVPAGLALWNLDLPKIDVPLAVFFHEALMDGGLPLWNERLGLGFPLYAEGQIGAFYPPNWLIYQAEPLTALSISRSFHLILAGIGTGLVALRVAGSRTGAVLATAVAILGGAIVTKLEWTNLVAAYAWLPWIVLPLVRRPAPTRRGVAAAGLLFGVQALAGHPNTWLLTGLTAAVLLLTTGRDLRSFGRVAAVGVIGGAVGAVQLLPTLLLTTLSVRSEGLSPDDVFTSSATVFDPLVFGFGQAFVRTGTDGWDFFTSWYPDGTFALLEATAFVGLAMLGLAAIGAGTRRARRWLVIGAVLLAIPVVAALRPEPWLAVPILNGLRSPVRAYLVVAWVLGLLAAIGVGRLGRDVPASATTTWLPAPVVRAGLVMGAFAAVYAVVTLAAVAVPALFDALYRSAANDDSPENLARVRDLAIPALTATLPVIVEVAVGIGAFLLILVGAMARWRDRIWAIRIAVVALAIAPLTILSPLANPLRPVDQVWPRDSELATELRARSPNRVLTLDPPGFYDGAPDRLAAAGVPDLEMFSSLDLAATSAVLDRARHGPDVEAVRRLVGVDTLVTFAAPCPGADSVGLSADDAVVCDVVALTDAYWIPDEVIDWPDSGDPPASRGVLPRPEDVEIDVARAVAGAVPGSEVRSTSTELVVRVEAPAGGAIWIDRAWWPAWAVELDGEAVTPARALGGQLVAVGAGAHEVTLRLWPFEAVIGALVGAAVALVALAWAVGPAVSPWARRRP